MSNLPTPDTAKACNIYLKLNSVHLSTAVITFKQKMDKWKLAGGDKMGLALIALCY